MRTFADTRTRDVTKLIPRALTTVAAMAAAKKANNEFEARRHAAEQEAAKRWAEAERRRIEDQQAASLLKQLLKELESRDRLRAFVDEAGASGHSEGRLARFVDWAQQRLSRAEASLTPAALEERLAKARLFGSDG